MPKRARPARPAKPAKRPRQSQERARDEARPGGGPRYGGGPWRIADERGGRRYGHARNDDADPSELSRGEAEGEEDEAPTTADPELAAEETAGRIVSSGQREGIGRAARPRRPKRRAR
jgi:hypothetical protein